MKSKLLKIGMLVLVMGLLAGLAIPGIALAGKPDKSASPATVPALPANILKGKVVSIDPDGGSFVINTGDDNQVEITVDENTNYFEITRPLKLPASLTERISRAFGDTEDVERGLGNKYGNDKEEKSFTRSASSLLERAKNLFKNNEALINQLRKLGEPAAFADIEVDDTVIVRVIPNEDLAKLVLIIKAPGIQRIQGEITAIDEDSITILKADESSATISWDANTRFVLKGLTQVQPEQTATVIYNIDTNTAKLVTVKPPTD